MPFLLTHVLLTLQRQLPQAMFVDATDLLHELLALKTVTELAIPHDVSERLAEAILRGSESCQPPRDGLSPKSLH